MRTVAVITGASSGIGEVFARKLAAEHDLLLIARRKDRLDALAADLSGKYGGRVDVLQADLSIPEQIAVVGDRIASVSSLALLVNNAGYGTRGNFWEVPVETHEAMHQVHVMATLRLTHAALKVMVAQNFGAVINVASVAAFVRSPGSASYSATKSWMAVFTEAVHLELKIAGSAATVQALCPGFTYSEFHDAMGVARTGMAPRAFWMSAEDVVDASLKGLHAGKLFVIPGWRYRVLASVLTKLPSGLRVAFERSGARRRNRELARGREQGSIAGQ